ncbi:hypothetical protein LEP1GSC050_0934 [Leptospira broomii serovar Hurstbridge str. 5399]|uniref:Uncharacterized protein n=1 Tax=Leptospira broomii serovar Hurstbridge str. 5399 TaxID=1049789 RepID=T0FHQ8_9LEPT|nr:hypothetical protein LEP1GSC050_0934 [Leptospira broomii serovar Hurstbridge str. 5399]
MSLVVVEGLRIFCNGITQIRFSYEFSAERYLKVWGKGRKIAGRSFFLLKYLIY